MIGETVRAVIDFGQEIPADKTLVISRRGLVGSGATEIEFISNESVISLLSDHVQLIDTSSNRLVEFTWRVFQSGNGQQAIISCTMIVKLGSLFPVSGTIFEQKTYTLN